MAFHHIQYVPVQVEQLLPAKMQLFLTNMAQQHQLQNVIPPVPEPVQGIAI